MRIAALTLLTVLALAAPAAAAPALVKVGDFAAPTYVTSPPGDASRLFVTEKAGTIRVVVNGAIAPQPFLDLRSITQSDAEERGLLSLAFAPDYTTSGHVYVYLTAVSSAATSGTAGELQIREYTRSAADPNVADPASARLLLTIPHSEAANHNGGQLQFGPDGKLYAGTGDGGGANNQFGHAQDPASWLGKLIRFDPAPVIVAQGLRNPWRFSFDRQTGQLVIGDVGQDNVEEVDLGLAPNYGWPCLEGTRANVSDPGCASGGTAPPVLERNHSTGVCSIVGGYVVRDPGLPTLAGRYVYGDYCDSAIRSADLAAPAGDAATGMTVSLLSSFGEDACGRLLAVSLSGPVYRIVDGAPSPCTSTAAPVAVAPPAKSACTLSARVTGLRSVRRRHRLSVALRADHACRATLTARIAGVARFRTATGSLTTRRRVLAIRLTAHGRAAVRRALRRRASLKVSVRVQAIDAAGAVRTFSRTYRIRG